MAYHITKPHKTVIVKEKPSKPFCISELLLLLLLNSNIKNAANYHQQSNSPKPNRIKLNHVRLESHAHTPCLG